MIDYRMDAEAADASLLVLSMAEGPVPDALLMMIGGGELTRGYAALITVAATRIAHSLNIEHQESVAFIREAAARSEMTDDELAGVGNGLDLMEAVWAEDREAVDRAMTPENHQTSMTGLSHLCGLLFDFEAASTGTESADVIEGYRQMALRVLAS